MKQRHRQTTGKNHQECNRTPPKRLPMQSSSPTTPPHENDKEKVRRRELWKKTRGTVSERRLSKKGQPLHPFWEQTRKDWACHVSAVAMPLFSLYRSEGHHNSGSNSSGSSSSSNSNNSHSKLVIGLHTPTSSEGKERTRQDQTNPPQEPQNAHRHCTGKLAPRVEKKGKNIRRSPHRTPFCTTMCI